MTASESQHGTFTAACHVLPSSSSKARVTEDPRWSRAGGTRTTSSPPPSIRSRGGCDRHGSTLVVKVLTSELWCSEGPSFATLTHPRGSPLLFCARISERLAFVFGTLSTPTTTTKGQGQGSPRGTSPALTVGWNPTLGDMVPAEYEMVASTLSTTWSP